MAQYLLSVPATSADYEDVDYSDPAIQQSFTDVGTFNEQLQADGHWVFGGGLTNITDATMVDGTGDDVIVTDGPFAESKEFLGGFWVIEAPDLDTALKLAAGASKACQGRLEVRPLQGDPTNE